MTNLNLSNYLILLFYHLLHYKKSGCTDGACQDYVAELEGSLV